MTRNTQILHMNGFLGAVLLAVGGALAAALLVGGERYGAGYAFLGAVLATVCAVATSGFAVIQPNEAVVVTFFGKYVGALAQSGFHLLLPLSARRKVSLRVSNFISDKMKVNDADGNPIEIASIVVWEVSDPGKALLDVQDFREFVRIQSETALRTIASRFPYDAHGTSHPSLRGSAKEVCDALRHELQTHLAVAGITVRDAQISHLAYAPEIAQAMLRRQQAQAIVAARMQIVDGAVGMVELALKQLGEKQVVNLDEERKAQMVSNLLVTLVAESSVQPIVNTGSLY